MTKILVVTGSVRPGSANEKVVQVVVRMLQQKGADVTIADLKQLDLPFFDDPMPPSAPEFAPTDERVLAWTKLVADADDESGTAECC